MLIFIVPMFEDLYADLGGDLPAPTRMLLTLSGIVTGYWWAVLIVGIGAFFAFKAWKKTESGRVMWDRIKLAPHQEIWDIKSEEREELINHIKDRLAVASTRIMDNPGQMLEISTVLNKDALTIGFARRFATYKRADLIFQDIERLKSMLKDRWKPLQIIFAGKAHPDDHPGKMILQRIVNIAKDPEFAGRIVFVLDFHRWENRRECR